MAKLASPTDKRRKLRAILKRKQLTVMPGGFSRLYEQRAGARDQGAVSGLPHNGVQTREVSRSSR